MKTLAEFQQYFEKEMQPRLLRVQAEREATRCYVWKPWRWILLGELAFCIAFALLASPPGGPNARAPWYVALIPISFFLTLVVAPIALLVRKSRWNKRWGNAEKQTSLIPAIRFLTPEFTYEPARFAAPELVKASGLFEFDGKLSSVVGDDRFTGRIGETQVEFSEVTATTSRKVSTKNGTKTVYTPHQGLFLSADFNKRFDHYTVVLPDPGEQLLGATVAGWLGTLANALQTLNGQVGQGSGGPLRAIRMEHLEFEKQFQVFSSDPVEANYILTPNVMERLAAFQARVKFGLSLTFRDSRMHAFLPAGPLFEEDASADWSRFETYRPYYEQLYVVFDLVEAMQLNTRLWTKS